MNARLSLILISLVVVMAVAGTALATPVAICNPSFEGNGWDPAGAWNADPDDGIPPLGSDSVADGQTRIMPTGWMPANSSNPLVQTVTSDPDTGVTLDTMFVNYNPTAADFPGAAGNGALPGTADGSQALYNKSNINGVPTDNDICVMQYPKYMANRVGYDNPAGYVTLQKNQKITYTVAIGRGLTDPLGWFAGFSLVMGYSSAKGGLNQSGEILEKVFDASENPAPGTFKDFSVTVYTDDILKTVQSAGPIVGNNLYLGVIIGTGTYADNVRLDITPAPEPSTLVLLASGLIGLLAYAWRKRK
jgi:hypothetical protein